LVGSPGLCREYTSSSRFSVGGGLRLIRVRRCCWAEKSSQKRSRYAIWSGPEVVDIESLDVAIE